jgi:ribosomal protein S18 acetylase RimI-like enzyme
MITTTKIQIRRAGEADAAALAQFAAQTFSDTFGADNNPEDMAMFLAGSFGVEVQRREIADARWITLLAELETSLVGYAQLRREEVPECVTGPAPIELYRFYVGKDWHGRGIAQQLMAAVKAAAIEAGAQTLWLGVWEHNPRASAFYAKCGFHDVGSHDFVLGTDRQTDRILTTSLG